MSINYLTDIQPLENSLSDDEIAVHLSARTAKAIPCEDTLVLLEGAGAIIEDPVTQLRSGSLIDYYQTLSGNDAQLMSWFLSHILGRGIEISSHDYPRSIQLSTLVAGLPSDLGQLADAMIALGGGQPDAGTTATTVSDVRNAYFANEAMAQRQLVADQKFNEFMSPVLNDVEATDADIASALVDWANSYTE